MSKLTFHMLTCIEVNFQKWLHFARLSPMKLGSHTQSGHGLALCGSHFKNNKTFFKKKDKSKENPPSTDLHYSKCHPEPHPFIFKRKKITKTVNTKDSHVTASLYTKKFTSLPFLGFCHKQLHICPYKAQHAWTNGHYKRQLAMALQRAEKLPQIKIIYSA